MKNLLKSLAMILSLTLAGLIGSVALAPAQAVQPAAVATKAKPFFQLKAYTKDQAITQCKAMGDQTQRSQCLTATKRTKWQAKPHSIKMVKAQLKSKAVQKRVKSKTATYNREAVKWATSPKFERDIDVCYYAFDRKGKGNDQKLSDCINLSISSHYMYGD